MVGKSINEIIQELSEGMENSPFIYSLPDDAVFTAEQAPAIISSLDGGETTVRLVGDTNFYIEFEFIRRALLGVSTKVNLDLSRMTITSIPDNAFKDCSCLKKVILPDGVRSIGSDAFYNCTSLESVNIPSSITVTPGEFAKTPFLEKVQEENWQNRKTKKETCEWTVSYKTAPRRMFVYIFTDKQFKDMVEHNDGEIPCEYEPESDEEIAYVEEYFNSLDMTSRVLFSKSSNGFYSADEKIVIKRNGVVESELYTDGPFFKNFWLRESNLWRIREVSSISENIEEIKGRQEGILWNSSIYNDGWFENLKKKYPTSHIAFIEYSGQWPTVIDTSFSVQLPADEKFNIGLLSFSAAQGDPSAFSRNDSYNVYILHNMYYDGKKMSVSKPKFLSRFLKWYHPEN